MLFSTFLMWLLADLFTDLPEIGDPDKPKLVFFFDEAHLLFDDASKAFLDSIEQTVRLIRSKGVGVFFVTQTPKDVPSGVLAQLANRVQHALRAFTPDDAKALKATVSTFPTSGYDLGQLLTQLGTGEAVITVLSERGAPTPVAWTRMRAPQSLMAPSPPETVAAEVAASPLNPKYATAVDRQSAYEMLAAKLAQAAPAAGAARRRGGSAPAPEAAPKPLGPTGQAGGVDGRAGREVVGVQVLHPLGRHGDRPGDHPQHLRRRQAPLTAVAEAAERRGRVQRAAGPRRGSARRALSCIDEQRAGCRPAPGCAARTGRVVGVVVLPLAVGVPDVEPARRPDRLVASVARPSAASAGPGRPAASSGPMMLDQHGLLPVAPACVAVPQRRPG